VVSSFSGSLLGRRLARSNLLVDGMTFDTLTVILKLYGGFATCQFSKARAAAHLIDTYPCRNLLGRTSPHEIYVSNATTAWNRLRWLTNLLVCVARRSGQHLPFLVIWGRIHVESLLEDIGIWYSFARLMLIMLLSGGRG
jgi:hypothetical protein